ncbi:Rho GTPase activation protein [Lactarius psammicola]|nr:Rho GTPase activation protein [Lactarius psammicola]
MMRMCIEEVEKRGLNTNKIYSVGSILDTGVKQLRRRLESEKSFSFSSTDNIHSIAALLRRYLLDLPEPLFVLPLRDCRNYRQKGARYTENDFSLLRSRIRELHPVHRASLGALLRHLLRVASHSDENEMTVEVLAIWFHLPVLRGTQVSRDGVDVKTLVMEDLIRNAHNLFDERPSPL